MADEMTRCAEGHFYDAVRHSTCPWCALPRDISMVQQASPAPLVQAGIRTDPVVGWLVCLSGYDRGRDYRLHAGKNFMGRSPTMDVVIENDLHVSREKHGVIAFDPKTKNFWILPGEASGLVHLNGEIVNTPVQMKGGDTIELGRTRLVLVPFCGEKFDWTEC